MVATEECGLAWLGSVVWEDDSVTVLMVKDEDAILFSTGAMILRHR
jgi:hypothetical protein